jgi:hypothetical protein
VSRSALYPADTSRGLWASCELILSVQCVCQGEGWGSEKGLLLHSAMSHFVSHHVLLARGRRQVAFFCLRIKAREEEEEDNTGRCSCEEPIRAAPGKRSNTFAVRLPAAPGPVEAVAGLKRARQADGKADRDGQEMDTEDEGKSSHNKIGSKNDRRR